MIGELDIGTNTCLVTLKPLSMSVIMVLAVPLGPSPCCMKRGVILGIGIVFWVAIGSGVSTFESLLFSQRLMFMFSIVVYPDNIH